MIETIAFYTFSVLTIISFVVVVTSNKAAYAMSALAAGMLFISGFFFTLGADFLGVVQIVVYAGAVMALYAFGMMFLDSSKEVVEYIKRPKLTMWLAIGSTICIIVMASVPLMFMDLIPDSPEIIGLKNPQAIGAVLFTDYLLAFELASLMLLVAMICGIILSGKHIKNQDAPQDEEETIKTFTTNLFESPHKDPAK